MHLGYTECSYSGIRSLTQREWGRLVVIELTIPADDVSKQNIGWIIQGHKFEPLEMTIADLNGRLPFFTRFASGDELSLVGYGDGILYSFQFFKEKMVSITLTFHSEFRNSPNVLGGNILLGVEDKGSLSFPADTRLLEQLFGKPTHCRKRILVDF